MGGTSQPLTVTYLLEDTALFGGVKVVCRQADLLHRRGHRVTVASPAAPPAWYALEAPFLQVADFSPSALPAADVTVATYWTTIAPALAGPGQAVHYCQGFEASYTHNRDEHPAILDAYGQDLPAFAVSPHLARMVAQRFGRAARVVPQPLEPLFRPRVDAPEQPSQPPRILVPSPFEIDWKGVETALAALASLRRDGFGFTLVRLSQWPLSDEERTLLEPDEFHHHLSPEAVARLLRTCDLALTPSWEQEGFGLPALEAMASGVPVVASEVACYLDFAAEAALLVPPRSPERLATAIRELLGDARRWSGVRACGLEVAARFDEATAGAAAEAALHWVASGAWRRSQPDREGPDRDR